MDDWTLNWQRDVERAPLPVRDYSWLYVCRIQGTRDKFRTVAQTGPEFVDDLPAATLTPPNGRASGATRPAAS